MNYYLTVALSMLIVIPAVIGLIRWRRIPETWYPFIILLVIGFFNECLSVLMIEQFRTNVVNYNIYLLVEMMLILWFFKSMGLFQKRRWLFGLLLAITICWWLAEVFLMESIFTFNHYTIILFAFITLLLASAYIVYLIFYETGRLLQEARFLTCLGLIIFSASALLVESIYLYGLSLSKTFRLQLQYLHVLANVFTNLIFILAILWIPTKRRYILPLQ